MNKQEFIKYIEKIPEDMDFTPMKVMVRGYAPNMDGNYKFIDKKIHFECTYTDMVHTLPYVKETAFDKIDSDSIRDELHLYEKLLEKASHELRSDDSQLSVDYDDLMDYLKKKYDGNINNNINIYCLSAILLSVLQADNDLYKLSGKLTAASILSLNYLYDFLRGRYVY